MKYTEFYQSEEDVVHSDKATIEAYKIAKTMYAPHWGRKDNKMCLTEKDMPVVYAFNLAEGVRRAIKNAGTDFSQVIDRENHELFSWGAKKQGHEVEWLYQRNTVLGISYYLLGFDGSTDEKILECLHNAALNVNLPFLSKIRFPNQGAMPYFNIFEEAIASKKANEADEEQGSVTKKKRNVPKKEGCSEKDIPLEKDTVLAKDIFNNVFRDGLDMDKIGRGLEVIFNNRIYHHQQRYWYIIYQWFLEIGFITSRRSGKDFRIWAIYMFGELGYSTQDDFSKAKAIASTSPSTWEKVPGHEDFISIRNMLKEVFPIEKRNVFLADGRYIDWKL